MNEMILWSPGVTLEHIEKQVILKAFRHYRGNKTMTSNALGISIRTLDTRLEKYESDGKQRELADAKRLADNENFLGRQRGFTTTEDGAVRLSSPAPGVQVESASQVASQHEMPMQERREVQGVLPKQASGSNTRGSRR